MPTVIPIRVAPERALSLVDTIRFVGLIARVRWLDRKLHAACRSVDRRGFHVAGGHLLAVTYRWLDVHERIGALLGLPEPPHVARTRVMLARPEDRAGKTDRLTKS